MFGKKSVLTFILHLTSIASRRYWSPSSKMIWKKNVLPHSNLLRRCICSYVMYIITVSIVLNRRYNILLYHLIQCCRIWNDNVSHVFSYNIVSLNFLLQYYNILYFDIKDHWLSFSSRWALWYIITYVSLLDFKRPFLIIISKELSICFNLFVIYFYLTIKTYYKFISVYSCIVIFASLRTANFDQWVRDYKSFLNLKSSFYVLCHNIVLTYNDHCYVCHNYVIYRYLLRCFMWRIFQSWYLL